MKKWKRVSEVRLVEIALALALLLIVLLALALAGAISDLEWDDTVPSPDFMPVPTHTPLMPVPTHTPLTPMPIPTWMQED
jgi:hypothetical protein